MKMVALGSCSLHDEYAVFHDTVRRFMDGDDRPDELLNSPVVELPCAWVPAMPAVRDDAGVAYEILSNQTVDHREAVAAVREKRAALFSGQ